LASVGFTRNGVELKTERRKPSGEKHCDIENLPSHTGVLAHFRFHEFNTIGLHAGGAKTRVRRNPMRGIYGFLILFSQTMLAKRCLLGLCFDFMKFT
jgi:hypothetical protein